mmetsp:Transcript_25840/g.81960  ORF Transcript_25840/g.81960 Transcript_25840/m.81960 type:complete len:103 (+) Transcript_25840:418-726(+)
MSFNGLLLVEQVGDKPVQPGIPPPHDYILSWDTPAFFMGCLPLSYIWLALINIPLLGEFIILPAYSICLGFFFGLNKEADMTRDEAAACKQAAAKGKASSMV